MPGFTTCSEAFRAARTRASVAAAIEDTALHLAIHDARQQGMSVRQTAAALSVPKSTVNRHWQGQPCHHEPPIWGDERVYVETWNTIWAHDPRERIEHAPWAWEEHPDGTRTVRLKSVSTAAADPPPTRPSE